MKMLISNDDGVHAPGIKALADAVNSLADIVVIAPDRNRSAASNSLTLTSPLRAVQMPTGYIAVNGTPTDSVHLALTGWLKEKPDLVLSGINDGCNLADDVLYSGTVAAAMEGCCLGYPAIAFSLATVAGSVVETQHFDAAAHIAKMIVEQAIKKPLEKNMLLNVNIPNLPLNKIKGIKTVKLGQRHSTEAIIKDKDPRNKDIFWVGPAGPGDTEDKGTDFNAIADGYVAVTPLLIDLTHKEKMQQTDDWVSSIDF